MSRAGPRHSARTSTTSSFTGLTSEYNYAYGEPALSDASSDEQIARAISQSKKAAIAYPRSPSLSRTSSTSSWTLVGHQSPSRASSISRGQPPPTPTPRYAADEAVARSLARSRTSFQTDIIGTPSSGPPLVVRSPSPSSTSVSSVSTTSTGYTYRSPPPPAPLSPLSLPARSLSTASRSPSIRSVSSLSSTRSSTSTVSASSRGTASIASIISSVAASSRHAPLEAAANALRASLPPSLSRSVSSVSMRSSATPRAASRAGSIRSVSTVASRQSTSSGIFDETEKDALRRLHTTYMQPIPCTNPGCGAAIPPSPLDTISFPTSIFSDNTSPPRALFAALHARCPACTQNHCRGCGVATGCGANCCEPLRSSPTKVSSNRLITYSSTSSPRTHYDAPYASPPCSVPGHCPAVRALGAAASLIAFDRVHLSITQHGRNADKQLLGPLHALAFFIAPPPQMQPSASSSRASTLLFSPQDGNGLGTEADAGLPALVRLSRVPGYTASLLQAEADVARWMDRAPAYGAILRVLRAFGDTPGCRGVLTRPIPVHSTAGSAVETWLRNRGEIPRSVALAGGVATTLQGLIRRLETARAALLRLAGALEFGPTVQQAHALCDGVLYLLLQDVLGDEEEDAVY